MQLDLVRKLTIRYGRKRPEIVSFGLSKYHDKSHNLCCQTFNEVSYCTKKNILTNRGIRLGGFCLSMMAFAGYLRWSIGTSVCHITQNINHSPPVHLLRVKFLVRSIIIPISNRHIDGLMQERRNSVTNALELRFSCTNPSIWTFVIFVIVS